MSPKLFVFFTLFFVSFNSQAQNIDSINYYNQNYDYQKSIDLINKIDENGTDLYLLNLKAAAFKGLSNYQESIVCYQKILTIDTSNVKCIIDLALSYQLIGDNLNSQLLLQKATQLSQNNNFLIQQLANSYFLTEDFDIALMSYLKIYSIDSSYYLTKQIAKCYDELLNFDSASIFYSKAIEMNSNDFLSTYRLASIYRKSENFVQGINLTNSYLKQDSLNLKMLRLNGILSYLNKDFGNSINRFKQCLELNDTSDITNKFLGYSYFKSGDFQNAKYYLEKAYLKNYLDMELCYLLGLSGNYSDDFTLGAEYLNRAIDLSKISPLFLSQVYQELGKAQVNLFDYEQALSSFLLAYELTPNDVFLMYKIARHYDYCIQNKAQAIRYYNYFLSSQPKKETPSKQTSENGELSYSNYESVKKRIEEIKEELFWVGNNADTFSIK